MTKKAIQESSWDVLDLFATDEEDEGDETETTAVPDDAQAIRELIESGCAALGDPSTVTLKQAIDYLVPRIVTPKGGRCLGCNRLAKRYKRKFNSGMSRILIWLHRSPGDPEGWVNVAETAPTYVRRSNEVSRLVLWGMVEEKPNDDPTKRNSGIYRITDKGREFVLNRLTVPSHVHIYDDRVVNWAESTTNIAEALGKKFNYTELMSQ